MTQPYSMDLRERAMQALADGATCRQVAKRFAISVSAVVTWSQRLRQTGSVAPAKMGTTKRSTLVNEREFILSRLAEHPSITTRQLAAELGAKGIKASRMAVWRLLRAEGMTFKKNAIADEQSRKDVARRRHRWRLHQKRIDPQRLVFVDETWAKTNMAPLRGWGHRGRRLIGRAPHGRWRTMTFLAALRADRIDAPFVFDGPINGARFQAWVAQRLAPTLTRGDVVIMDNLGSHKGKAVRAAIRDAGAHLLFLPPYSPDLNPIEQVFAKLKHLLREAQERTCDATWRRIGSLLDRFTPRECANYIQNAGYASVFP